MIKDLLKKAKYITVPQPKREADEKPNAGMITMTCPKCQTEVSRPDYLSAGKVCPNCGQHARRSAAGRLGITVDQGSFAELFGNLQTQNPLEFDGYLEKIDKLRKSTGLNEAVLTGTAKIHGINVAIGIMDSHFLMGSMGCVVGEKLALLFEYATEMRLPVIVFCCSGGARMHEGILSLMQMAKVSAAVNLHSQNGLLYITVLTDPTTGGVTASFASLGDIILAEPNAIIGFTGQRVIEGTIGHKLPEGFQSSSFMLDHGFVDKVVKRTEMRATLHKLLKLHHAQGGI